MANIAIVVVGYNRDISLSRLLNSLSKAHYDNKDIPLIISIDKSDNSKVVDVANKYNWGYGNKIVNIETTKLGLRNHIIKCGNLALKYGSVIVLEDDLYVSCGYYIYAKEAINKYKSNSQIAGISLYAYSLNEYCSRPFIPVDDGTDAYFLQIAQSWGQVWTDTMWKGFYEWYVVNQDKIYDEPDMPKNVTEWPDSSWKKYYIRYLVKTNKYFVYPRISLTTNFGDKGQHNINTLTSYQVPLLFVVKFGYNFPELDDNSVCYDAYFERIGIGKKLGLPDEHVCLDLYSTKFNSHKKKYWITTEQANYKIHSCFGLEMRPHEANIYQEIAGNDIYCYDTSIITVNNMSNKNEKTFKIITYYMGETKRNIVWIYGYLLLKKLLLNVVARLSKIYYVKCIIDKFLVKKFRNTNGIKG